MKILKNKINFELVIIGKGVDKMMLENYIYQNDLKKCKINWLPKKSF